jgi:hypothetical protein
MSANQKSTLLAEILTPLPKYATVPTIDTTLADDKVPEPTILAIAGCTQDTV